MRKILFIGSIVGLCIVLRLVPHAPNVAPMTALALFSGYAVRSRGGLAVALLTNLIADFVIGFYAPPVMLAVYGSYLAIALIGRDIRRRPVSVALGTLVSSLLFFISTNTAVWAAGEWYPKTAGGLLSSYMNGLPFLRFSLIGDLIYGGLFYIAYEVYLRYASLPSPARERPATAMPLTTYEIN